MSFVVKFIGFGNAEAEDTLKRIVEPISNIVPIDKVLFEIPKVNVTTHEGVSQPYVVVKTAIGGDYNFKENTEFINTVRTALPDIPVWTERGEFFPDKKT